FSSSSFPLFSSLFRSFPHNIFFWPAWPTPEAFGTFHGFSQGVAISCHVTGVDKAIDCIVTKMNNRLPVLVAAAILMVLPGRAQSFRPPSLPLVTFYPFLRV